MNSKRPPSTTYDHDPRPAAPPLNRRGFLVGGAAGLTALVVGARGAVAGPAYPAGDMEPRQERRRFAGRVVLITGATSGIGEATARAFATEGARVFFGGRRQALGEEVAVSIRAAGGDARFMQLDVREEPQVAAFVRECVRAYGGLDIAFNNAGIEGPEGTYGEVELEGRNGYRDVMRTNVDGVFFAMRHELPVMRERGRGVVINTASVQGSRGGAKTGPYSASKHAVIGLTRSAALAHAKEGLRILSISPGPVDTALLRRMYDGELEPIAEGNPSGRIAQPREIAAMVLKLASPDATFLNGEDVKVDGGSSA
jgi:NAD(P)-dependent dehydrogenase (short-subunit alcohol dehydrogenase family)